jgi:ketosteroid isomerase-like protein
MSQENVENLRAFMDIWTLEAWRREASKLAQVDMYLLDSHVIYEDMDMPDHIGETYHGHEGVVRATQRWIEAYHWLEIELKEILDSDEHLVSIHRVRARAHTGVEGEGTVAFLWTFQGGKVVQFRMFQHPERALEVAGLRE